MNTKSIPATIAEVEHHSASVNGTTLHFVSAGSNGSPILLVHGFPESWWAFRKAIPLLAKTHRVVAVDLRGFGDSGTEPGSRPLAKGVGDRLSGTYGNFIPTDTPEVLARIYPDATLDRLRQVKTTWDPHNLFSRNHNIRPLGT